jgi:Secretion system C-terminal sorting domain
MSRLSIISLFLVITGVTQNSYANKTITATDSLVDVFPLRINNQWTYNYDYEYRDDPGRSPMYQWSDTGTVNLQIINNIVTIDSTRWFVQETGSHWTRYNTQPWGGPSIEIDTFEIIENNHGNHRLYRAGDVNVIFMSVLPFLPNLVDTACIYRYAMVDTGGYKNIDTRTTSGTYYRFLFNFKQDVGLTAVSEDDGCLCLTYYWTSHSLRSSIITGVSNSQEFLLPRSYRLNQNYPNPFNPSTTITFTLPLRSFVSLKVFDLIGREVATIVSEEMQAGNYTRQWNASDLPSGTYFYRLQAGSFVETKKLILLK